MKFSNLTFYEGQNDSDSLVLFLNLDALLLNPTRERFANIIYLTNPTTTAGEGNNDANSLFKVMFSSPLPLPS